MSIPFKTLATSFLTGLTFFFAHTDAEACTSFLVGKKASTDGSAFITYNQDDYGMFGRLQYLPAGKHAVGEMRKIVDGDTNHYLGEIPETPYTYAVTGYINEHQLAITEKGAVWVAVRIPDDCIACHANQSRIHKFNLKDKNNVMYAKDVITFARKKGFFSGKDVDFSFANAYAPADFGAIRYCETRVWSFYNKWVNGMERYLDYVDGKHIGKAEPMPLYFKPKQQLSLQDVMNSMRDHYEGTPFDITKDAGAGPYDAPYRPTPLSWEYQGKKYFNERPISTQQTAGTYVIQVRASMPNAVGGVLWFGNDDPNMVAYTPIYCCVSKVPECYNPKDANDVNFSWNSAFWVENWVSNMTYPRYSQLFPSLQAVRQDVEGGYIAQQAQVESHAQTLLVQDPARAKAYLTDYSTTCANQMLARWKKLGEYLIVKYNDQTVKPEKDGKFELTPDGLGKAVERTGFNDSYKKIIVDQTGDKYLQP